MNILVLGDYNPEYLTHREIDAALALFPGGSGWVATDSPSATELADRDGVWLLPGTPYRNDGAAFGAIRHCLQTGTPFLGTCGGFQYACLELARIRAGITDPGHAETAPDAEDQVVIQLACSLYGETRVVTPAPGTMLSRLCGTSAFDGFHFCGYGLDPRYAQRLQETGVVLSAYAPDAGVEALEISDHPFFLATAFQPQVGTSNSGVLHPLIVGFLDAAAARREQTPPGRENRPRPACELHRDAREC
jgi:CTP synthase (UTP-ammonia lyase)